MKEHAFRLTRGKRLREEIQNYCSAAGISAAAVVTCVGCLDNATLRLAEAKEFTEHTGPWEICSLVGTIADGDAHLHVTLSGPDGAMLGGHLKDALVSNTAEIVLAELDMKFKREHDPETRYMELVVIKEAE